MHLLLMILRLLLDLLSGPGRSGLSMAARADGRVEQLPADRALSEQPIGRKSARPATRRAAPRVRAEREAGPEAPPPQ
jgi:hypothetical protein